jgi:peroxidase
MALSSVKGFFLLLLITCMIGMNTSAELSANFYGKTCPKAVRTIRKAVQDAVKNESRMGASLLRLHFHDCFVQVIYFQHAYDHYYI